MKIGVELRLGADPGELFADARALEAAGADSFWAAGDVHQLTLLAAIAAVTWRARLVLLEAEATPEALVALDRLSRGRLARASRAGDAITLPAAEGDPERWVRAEIPSGRQAWKEIRARSEADGTSGLLVPNGPRLLDLLRNPDVEDDRPDLKLAFG